MHPIEQSSQQLPEETLAEPLDQEAPPTQPIPPLPQPQRTRPPSAQRLSQPTRPPSAQGRQTPGNGSAKPFRLPRLTPKVRVQLVWACVGGIVAMVLVICIVGAVALAASSQKALSNASSHPTAGATTAPTSAPTQQAAHLQVGDSITTADWQITITSASAYKGNSYQFEVPGDGDTFLVVKGTFKNLTNQSLPLSTLLFFTLQDTQGNTYSEAVFNSLNSPDSPVLANRSTQGEWGYEVPLSVHAFVLLFSDDLGHTTSIWDITI